MLSLLPSCTHTLTHPLTCLQAKDQETNTEAESTDDDEEPGVTSHEVGGFSTPCRMVASKGSTAH